MNDFDPTVSSESSPAHVGASGTPVDEIRGGDSSALRPRLSSSPEESTPGPIDTQYPGPGILRWFANKKTRAITAAAVLAIAIGLSVGLATSGATPSNQPLSSSNTSSFGARDSNARSGPAAGGAAGTISAISKSSFTITTSVGQSATITETPSTKYESGTASISANALTKGESVLVLGTTSNTTISAAQVIWETPGSRMFVTSPSVVPFTRGAPTNLRKIGHIPADWTQGSGTIVGGTAANEATKAALAAYPGGIVDRVVKRSDSEYNVHYIGVNWPHHVFVNQDFKVVGAE